MSWEALSWAAKRRVKKSADKLILLALAERHNPESGLAYPSVAWLAEFGSLDRKTVMAALDRLEAEGLISDSGQRAGKTLQVKCYRLNLNGVPTIRGEVHYVYRLSDAKTGEFYIGVRSYLGDIATDSYMGSGRWPTGAIFRGNELRKEIIGAFESRSAAEKAEAEHIREAMQLPLCKNIAKEFQKRDRSKRDPKKGRLNSPVFPRKQSQKRDTDTVREPVASEAKASSAKRAKPELAHRLPDDWSPEPLTDGTVAFDIVAAWEPGRIERELSKFRDYWKAASGSKARKHDWQAAWRTWIGNADEFGSRSSRGRQSSGSAWGGARAAVMGGPGFG